MPGREFSGGFARAAGQRRKYQFPRTDSAAFLDYAFFPRETATV
jgi:hypothetical protein